MKKTAAVQPLLFEEMQVVAPEPQDWYERTKKNLELISKMQEQCSKLMQEMLDAAQEGMSEDEKLMINNPKEYYQRQKIKTEQNKKSEPMPSLTTEAIEVLKSSTITDKVVKLPEGQLDRKIYLEVKNRLELIGGKWKGNKVQGFVFQEDPSELLEQIANGESRNIKKEFQFFATPDALADRLVELAGIQLAPNCDILEPSAGQGAIVKAIHRLFPNTQVYCFELMPLNQTFLKKIPNAVVIGDDFLQHEGDSFDYIIANPPFSKNQDIDHIYQMYKYLNPGGRIVTVASKHWQLSNNNKEVNFREFLDAVPADIIDIEAGAFKESGTNISACIIIIDK